MKRITVFVGMILLLGVNLCFSQTQEELTITTYYPSPYGVYKTLRLFPSPTIAGCQEGELFYDDGTDFGSPGPGVYYCDGTDWQTLGGGYWTFDDVNSYLYTSDVDLGQSWNVGIGITDPQEKLHVIGSARFQFGGWGVIGLGPQNFGGSWYEDFWFDGGDDDTFYFKHAGVGTGRTSFTHAGVPWEIMTIFNNGNVGIGFTEPSYRLDIAHPGANNQVRIQGAWENNLNSNSRVIFNDQHFGIGAGQYGGVGDYEDALVLWSFNGVDRGILFASTSNGSTTTFRSMQHNMFIDGETGNVGIGTANPEEKLHVIQTGDGHAVRGETSDTWGYGVWGRNLDSSGVGYKTGVMGSSALGIGVYGNGGNSGVYGKSTSGNGVHGNTDGASSYGGYFVGGLGLYGERIEAGGDQLTATKRVYDIAEDIDAPGCESGDVAVVDPDNNRTVIKSTKPYDVTIAGIISENPVFQIGKTEGFKPLALAGQVYCKVTTDNGPINRGDLLVTSSKPGYAMKAEPDKLRPGMILGKALEPLEEGEGKIVVLVSLQ